MECILSKTGYSFFGVNFRTRKIPQKVLKSKSSQLDIKEFFNAKYILLFIKCYLIPIFAILGTKLSNEETAEHTRCFLGSKRKQLSF